MSKTPAVIAFAIVLIALVGNDASASATGPLAGFLAAINTFLQNIHAIAPAKQDEPVKVILSQPMVTPGPDILVTSVLLTFPPGDSGSPPHFHSGPTIGYVIEGEFLFQVEGEPQRIIPAGEAFYELDRAIHVWGGNASNRTTCKVVATIYGRPNENFLTFLGNYTRESRGEALALAKNKV